MLIDIPEDIFAEYHNYENYDIYIDFSKFKIGKYSLERSNKHCVHTKSEVGVYDWSLNRTWEHRDIRELILWMKQYQNDVADPDPTVDMSNKPKRIRYEEGLI